MCIIVYKPADKDLTDKQIESALNKNPDGYGFMALIDGKVVAKKGGIGKDLPNKKKTDEDIAEFLEAYAPFRKLECAVHFRLKSHGAIDETNTHPYKVGDSDCYMMHNGIMPAFANESDKTKSDTWHFVQHIAKFVDENWLRNEAFSKIMQKLIGNSRVIFLDEKGFYLPYRDSWAEKDGILYSNKHNITGVDNGYYNFWEGMEHEPISSLPRQNQSDFYFLTDGTRIEEKRLPKSGPPYNKSIQPTKTNFPALPSSDSVSRVSQIDKVIESHTVVVPKSAQEWKNLTATELEDLLLEEPETIGEAFFDLLHR